MKQTSMNITCVAVFCHLYFFFFPFLTCFLKTTAWNQQNPHHKWSLPDRLRGPIRVNNYKYSAHLEVHHSLFDSQHITHHPYLLMQRSQKTLVLLCIILPCNFGYHYKCSVSAVMELQTWRARCTLGHHLLLRRCVCESPLRLRLSWWWSPLIPEHKMRFRLFSHQVAQTGSVTWACKQGKGTWNQILSDWIQAFVTCQCVCSRRTCPVPGHSQKQS